MPVLGRSEIVTRLHSGNLVVSPLLSGDQIGAASVDLRMGTVALFVRSRGQSHVDPLAVKSEKIRAAPHERAIAQQQKHERFEIPFGTKLLVHPGSLVLVPTFEWVHLPSDIHGSVTARSTWAREGLSIATAVFVEPGYRGVVTLEIANLGDIPIALYPGLRIAQIAFSTVEGDTRKPAKGQFDLSFEPRQGVIAKEDEFLFLP